MAIKKRDLYQCLLTKFGFEEVSGSRHEAVAIVVEGRKIATTRFSRAGHEICNQILTMMARQLWVQLGFLKKMYGCSKDRDDYLDHLRRTNRFE